MPATNCSSRHPVTRYGPGPDGALSPLIRKDVMFPLGVPPWVARFTALGRAYERFKIRLGLRSKSR